MLCVKPMMMEVIESMERTFNISVRGKIAKNLSKTFYVCGNSDYAAHFDFDAEWDEHQFKTARFIGGDGTHIDRIFSGNECEVPVFMDTYQITVGVFAGNLHTTTPAIIPAKRSILSGGSAPAMPPKDDYAQMMGEINAAADRAGKAADRAEEIAEAIGPGGGDAGQDGVTFIPSVSKDGVISWTNNGGMDNPESVNIAGPQGEKGDTGPQGPQGDKGDKGDKGDTGSDGKDGYTPVRGADYWTAEDKEQMVSDVLAAIPSAEGVTF